jgi:hypothetical protein
MYNLTQQRLKEQGITELTLFRGVRIESVNSAEGKALSTSLLKGHEEAAEVVAQFSAFGEAPQKFGRVFTGEIIQAPMSSYSSDLETAINFSGGSNSAVYAIKVPASRVIGMSGTGYGCLDEKEFVLLAPSKGDAEKALVFVRHYLDLSPSYTQELLGAIFAGRVTSIGGRVITAEDKAWMAQNNRAFPRMPPFVGAILTIMHIFGGV